MTLTDLADKEIKLYSAVIEIYDGKIKLEPEVNLDRIFTEYKNIHKEYAQISDKQIEGLKRGLFIQWYALTEPNYLTGISELDIKAEREIMTVLKNRIDQNKTDEELIWMMNYYLAWDWVFEKYKDIAKFKKIDEEKISISRKIETQGRGQMGIYWNSILTE